VPEKKFKVTTQWNNGKQVEETFTLVELLAYILNELEGKQPDYEDNWTKGTHTVEEIE
jgi:hypothetical protein